MTLPLVVMLTVFPVAAALAGTRNLYLNGSGIPQASLFTEHPSGSLGNLDPARNDDPGLTVQKGGSGAGENDATKYQIWVSPAGEMSLSGPVSFTFWSAMKDFTTDKGGVVRAYLLDCTPSGSGCSTISSSTAEAGTWSPSGDWTSRTISFGSVTHSIDSGRSLAVKIIVADTSDDDMWFAYGATAYPSRLTVELVTATTTTTTTTQQPTTTTAAPPATTSTTTTTAQQPTTTTAAPPTTTSRPPTPTTSPAPATTTTDPPVPTTTTTTTTTPRRANDPPPPATTTTSSIPQPGLPREPETRNSSTTPDDGDAAMAALPDIDGTVSESDRGLSSRLLRALDVVIPPFVAAALMSPLMLLEALIRAFVRTGRDLLAPGLILLLLALWTARDLRRKQTPIGEPK